MKTKILKTDLDWKSAKNDCRTSMGKDDTSLEPSREFIRKLLISEHSPVTQIRIKFIWEGIKSWVSVHFARHWLGWYKVITSKRTERTGVDRNSLPQDTPVDMKVEANPLALINVSRVRLCYKASMETRKQMEDLKQTINDEVDKDIAFVMQKNCIYRAGCPEFQSCGYWDSFKTAYKDFDLLNIETRYTLADSDFYERD